MAGGRRSQKGSQKRGAVIAISLFLIALIVGLGIGTGWNFSKLSFAPGGLGAATGPSCEVFTTINGQAGVSLTSITANYFVPNSAPVNTILGAQSLTAGTKTDYGAQIAPPFTAEFTSSSNYQFWATIPVAPTSGQAVPLVGLPTGASGIVQYSQAPGGASYSCIYQVSVLLPAAPASCASATTNCKVQILYNTPGSGPSAFNGLTSQTWNVEAWIFTSGGTAGQVGLASYPIYQTTSNTLASGSPTTLAMYLVVYANTTDITLSCPNQVQSNIYRVSGTTTAVCAMQTSGPLVNTAGGFCQAGYTSTTNPCIFADEPVNIIGGGTTTGHTLIAAWVVGEQISSFLYQNVVVPGASTSLAASTSGTAGTPSGFSQLTPTSAPYSAVPSILFNQYATTSVMTGT